MRTRAEHLQWCKDRAHEYLARGDVHNALTSMLSDLSKHPETKLRDGNILHILGMSIMMRGDHEEARRFIDGFN